MADGLPGGHPFTIRQRTGPSGKAWVFLAGELDLAAVDLLADWADQACQRLPRQVTLDLAGLTFVDATGARTLAAACACLRAHGGRVSVTGACPQVRHVFRLLGLAFGDHEVRPVRAKRASG
jgi:anti-sigma B factor antagonist